MRENLLFSFLFFCGSRWMCCYLSIVQWYFLQHSLTVILGKQSIIHIYQFLFFLHEYKKKKSSSMWETLYENSFLAHLPHPPFLPAPRHQQTHVHPHAPSLRGLLRKAQNLNVPLCWNTSVTVRSCLHGQFIAFEALCLQLEAFWKGILNNTWKQASRLFQLKVSRLVAFHQQFSVWGQISRSRHPTVLFSEAEQMPKLSETFGIPVLPAWNGLRIHTSGEEHTLPLKASCF